jgi:PilZ domain
VSENRAITDDSDGSRPNKKRRRWKRRLFASKCFAYFQNGHNASWCSIANISPSGARIRGLRPNETLPDRMTLVFSDRGLIERDCKIVWSDGSDVAVEFIGIPRSVALVRTAVCSSGAPDSRVPNRVPSKLEIGDADVAQRRASPVHGENGESYLPKSRSDFSATFTTIAFDDSSLRWLEINT